MRGTWRFEPLSHSRRQALWASLACKGPSPYAGTGANSCCCLSAARQVEHRKRRESLALQLFALLSFSLLLVFSSYTFFCTCMLIRRSLQDSCLSSILLLSARDILLLRTSITIYLVGGASPDRKKPPPPASRISQAIHLSAPDLESPDLHITLQHLPPFARLSPSNSPRRLVHVWCCRESHQGLRVTVKALSYTDSARHIRS